MEHPLIIQPARVKYLHIELYSGDTLLWQNYDKEPSEDKQAYFSSSFQRDGHHIIIPADSTAGKTHNLATKETKSLHYTTPAIQKGNRVVVSLFVQLAKKECLSIVELENQEIIKPLLIKRVERVW
jgi:hypothetical protein